MPAISWVLSLLVLKLTRTRRVSHVDDLLLTDLAAALLAGLTTLARRPRSPTTPTPSHDYQRAFLSAWTPTPAVTCGKISTSPTGVHQI